MREDETAPKFVMDTDMDAVTRRLLEGAMQREIEARRRVEEAARGVVEAFCGPCPAPAPSQDLSLPSRIACSVLQVPVGLGVAEGHTTLGIEFQAPDSAPAAELLRIDYDADERGAPRPELGFAALGTLMPLLPAGWKQVTVRHDAQDRRIIVFAVPAEPGELGDG